MPPARDGSRRYVNDGLQVLLETLEPQGSGRPPTRSNLRPALTRPVLFEGSSGPGKHRAISRASAALLIEVRSHLFPVGARHPEQQIRPRHSSSSSFLHLPADTTQSVHELLRGRLPREPFHKTSAGPPELRTKVLVVGKGRHRGRQLDRIRRSEDHRAVPEFPRHTRRVEYDDGRSLRHRFQRLQARESLVPRWMEQGHRTRVQLPETKVRHPSERDRHSPSSRVGRCPPRSQGLPDPGRPSGRGALPRDRAETARKPRARGGCCHAGRRWPDARSRGRRRRRRLAP